VSPRRNNTGKKIYEQEINFTRYFICLIAVVLAAGGASAQTSAFSYQGRLSEMGKPSPEIRRARRPLP